jgi:hypothetical protein
VFCSVPLATAHAVFGSCFLWPPHIRHIVFFAPQRTIDRQHSKIPKGEFVRTAERQKKQRAAATAKDKKPAQKTAPSYVYIICIIIPPLEKASAPPKQ